MRNTRASSPSVAAIADAQTRHIAEVIDAAGTPLTVAEIARAVALPEKAVGHRLKQCGPSCFELRFRLFAKAGADGLSWELTGRGTERLREWRNGGEK